MKTKRAIEDCNMNNKGEKQARKIEKFQSIKIIDFYQRQILCNIQSKDNMQLRMCL